MTLSIKQTLLQRAAKLLHGKDKLAVRLDVPEPLLDAWMDGTVDMPETKMPRLSAILNDAADQTWGQLGSADRDTGLSRGPVDSRAVEKRKQDLLRRAADLMGRDELAVRLKVPIHLLEDWMNGHATMPDRKLTELADIFDEISGYKE